MFRNALILLGALLGSLGAVTVSLAAEIDDCECSCRDSRSSSEPALRQLLDEFLAGASVNDAAVHDRFWDEDLVYTSSAGERFGKQTIMDGLSESETDSESEDAEPPHYSAAEVSVNEFGPTAVVTFRLLAEQDGSLVGEYFNTGVFRCAENSWRAVTWQATRVKAQ